MNRIRFILEHRYFTIFITTMIVLNAITLGLETDKRVMASIGGLLVFLDTLILGIFTVEILLKLLVYRVSFFKSGWNIFDFTIVSISYIPFGESLSVFRSLRILRVLRLFSIVPQLRRVINALFVAIPGMFAVISVLLIVFYVSAVLSTNLFGTSDDPDLQLWFGTIGASMYTLFQIMTLESWSMGIVRPTIELYPWAWVFFVPFIIITSFAVLNLFIGIIVDAMHSSAVEEDAQKRQNNRKKLEDNLMALQLQLDEIDKKLDKLTKTQDKN